MSSSSSDPTKVGDRVRFKKSFPLNHSEERAGETGVVTEIVPGDHEHANPLLVVRLDDGRVADGVRPELVEIIVGH